MLLSIPNAVQSLIKLGNETQMNTFFAFIDESGDYKGERTQAFTRRYPYYIKACFLISDHSWKQLDKNRKHLSQKHQIGILNELKWNHLWKLHRRDVKGVRISYANNEEYLRNITYGSAESYAREFMASLPDYDPIILISITPSCVFADRVKRINIERMHFQNITQRIEMEMQNREGDNIVVLISDQLSIREHERKIQDSYHQHFHAGDVIDSYSHIMDSIYFQRSHQCCGLQMADFIAGFVFGF